MGEFLDRIGLVFWDKYSQERCRRGQVWLVQIVVIGIDNDRQVFQQTNKDDRAAQIRFLRFVTQDDLQCCSFKKPSLVAPVKLARDA